MNRIFISLRSSDGKKDAARLAGGTSWRDAISATPGSQPVVLVPPDLSGAEHPEGVTMPSPRQLPDALGVFTEAHAQRLRTDDWNTDLPCSLVLTASADGRELTGRLWSNDEQATTPLRLLRRP